MAIILPEKRKKNQKKGGKIWLYTRYELKRRRRDASI
jgi:hypothetical protein